MTDNADKRSVATDALETLGMKIDAAQGRDAIHLAVEPVTALCKLHPGQDIGVNFQDGKTVASDKFEHIGIVDPFLKSPVFEGEMFWLVIYPRKITSLRHVWEHPAFDDNAPQTVQEIDPVGTSIAWIKDYADRMEMHYQEIMKAAKEWVTDEEYLIQGGRFEGVYLDQEFWDHYKIITGESGEGSFFSCSC